MIGSQEVMALWSNEGIEELSFFSAESNKPSFLAMKSTGGKLLVFQSGIWLTLMFLRKCKRDIPFFFSYPNSVSTKGHQHYPCWCIIREWNLFSKHISWSFPFHPATTSRGHTWSTTISGRGILLRLASMVLQKHLYRYLCPSMLLKTLEVLKGLSI